MTTRIKVIRKKPTKKSIKSKPLFDALVQQEKKHTIKTADNLADVLMKYRSKVVYVRLSKLMNSHFPIPDALTGPKLALGRAFIQYTNDISGERISTKTPIRFLESENHNGREFNRIMRVVGIALVHKRRMAQNANS